MHTSPGPAGGLTPRLRADFSGPGWGGKSQEAVYEDEAEARCRQRMNCACPLVAAPAHGATRFG